MKARRVYYDWEDVPTNPDYRLETAFEHTNPGEPPSAFEDETTIPGWILPASLLLIGGFLIGRWWTGRKQTGQTVVAGDTASGFDLLGAA